MGFFNVVEVSNGYVVEVGRDGKQSPIVFIEPDYDGLQRRLFEFLGVQRVPKESVAPKKELDIPNIPVKKEKKDLPVITDEDVRRYLAQKDDEEDDI